MTDSVLSTLSPHEFFHWFEIISSIPRGSSKEGRFIAFLQEFAQERGLPCEVDDGGNVFMRVPASPGYEDVPGILFQAHMDMVWVKDAGVDFDFETKPIHMEIRDGFLAAKGTTLGADNGVGLATMLAIADSSEIRHPSLEFLFTTEEEIGLVGIRKFDYGKILSRRMINMDCGDSHVIAVSSAGSAKMRIEADLQTETVTRDSQPVCALTVRVSGCKGGHSGLQIHHGGACAANAMGSLLAAVSSDISRIYAIRSAEKPILKWCEADLIVPGKSRKALETALTDRFSVIRKAYEATDPEIALEIRETEIPANVLSAVDSERVKLLLQLFQTGPYKTNPEDHSILITSGNIGRVVLTEGHLLLNFNIRSSEDNDKSLRVLRYQQLAHTLGMKLELLDAYSGWPEKEKSHFRDQFVRAHERLFGYVPAWERVHGGIEVGMITGAIPEMDAVGIAPTSRGAHTTEERLYINEVAPYWELIKEVLAEKE